jgi:cytoskeletal protein RodZ
MIGRWSTPPEEPAEKPKGFDDYDLRLGDIMRGERATLAKSLLDVQRELKIKATYIAAIENSDPTAFETPGFVAGYVRSYARYLGLDPEWAYKKFCEEGNFAVAHGLSAEASGAKSAKAQFTHRKPSQDPFENPNTPFVPRTESLFSRIEPGAFGSSLVLVALIGVIGYGGWSVLQEVQKVRFTPVDQAPGVVSSVDPLAPTAGIGATTETAGLTPPPAEALDRLYRPQALEVPVLTARDGPIATLDPQTVGTLLGVAPEKSETVLAERSATDDAVEQALVQVVADNAPEVVMFAVRPSWVRVRAADGTVLFEKILDAGEQWALPKTEEAPLLRAGNAGSVYFKVNGQAYGPAGTGPSVVKNVALGPEDLKANYTVADLTKDRDLARIVADIGTLPVNE